MSYIQDLTNKPYLLSVEYIPGNVAKCDPNNPNCSSSLQNEKTVDPHRISYLQPHNPT